MQTEKELRAIIATAAMQGMLTRIDVSIIAHGMSSGVNVPKNVAIAAVMCSDALIEELS